MSDYTRVEAAYVYAQAVIVTARAEGWTDRRAEQLSAAVMELDESARRRLRAWRRPGR